MSEGLKERLQMFGWQGYCKPAKEEISTQDNSSVKKKHKKGKHKDHKKNKKSKKKHRKE